ncbi:MAG: GNAT family N-acetyltransferase, partial [Sciscionella sp.]
PRRCPPVSRYRTGVQQVEINAGSYYLRALRADRFIDDRASIVAALGDPDSVRWVSPRANTIDEAGDYIALRAREWLIDRRYSWGIAEPSTGELLGEVGLKNVKLAEGSAEVACWTVPRHRGRGVMSTALWAALDFAFGGLGLRRIEYTCSADNWASRRVAHKCGFHPVETQSFDEATPDVLVWALEHSPAR